GYDYLAITDHTEALTVVGGLDDDELLELASDVKKLDEEYNIRLFTGAEANILENGTIDVSDEVAEQLDVVIASVHTGMDMDEYEATERLVTAIQQDGVDILGHPSGRLLNSREAYPYDFETVLETAKDEDVADTQVKRAVEEGVKISINTDAHSSADFDYIEYGVATARRGWAEAGDVINTFSADELDEWIS
ncbi:MAG: PHP domain-containing protein, partial [Halobacteria archaeon]|nr:PHP domain-containing protein [Halobacteria archaeon]